MKDNRRWPIYHGHPFRPIRLSVNQPGVRTQKIARYSKVDTLKDETQVEIRALRPEDRDAMLSAVGQTSARSLQRRFFAVKRSFTDKETSFFMNIDFVNHVALVAVVRENGHQQIVGGARYVIEKPGQAELAFTVVDDYQGRGIGAVLMRHLSAIARGAGLTELVAEVLADNKAMLRLFERSRLPIKLTRDKEIVHVTLAL